MPCLPAGETNGMVALPGVSAELFLASPPHAYATHAHACQDRPACTSPACRDHSGAARHGGPAEAAQAKRQHACAGARGAGSAAGSGGSRRGCAAAAGPRAGLSGVAFLLQSALETSCCCRSSFHSFLPMPFTLAFHSACQRAVPPRARPPLLELSPALAPDDPHPLDTRLSCIHRAQTRMKEWEQGKSGAQGEQGEQGEQQRAADHPGRPASPAGGAGQGPLQAPWRGPLGRLGHLGKLAPRALFQLLQVLGLPGWAHQGRASGVGIRGGHPGWAQM